MMLRKNSNKAPFDGSDVVFNGRSERLAFYRNAGLPIDVHDSQMQIEQSLGIVENCHQIASFYGDEDYGFLFESAKVHLNGPNYSEQIQLLEKAIHWAKESGYPDDYYLRAALGVYLLFDEGRDSQEAILSLQKADSLEPNDPATLFWLGRAYLNHGDYQKALDCFDQVMVIKPSDSYAMYWIGITLHRMGVFDLADECFDRAPYMREDIRIIPPWLGRAMLLRKDTGRPYRWTDQVFDIRSDFFDPMLGKANVFRSLNQFDQVVQWCKRVLASDDNETEAKFEKGIAYCLIDQNKEAIHWFQEVLESQPNNFMAMYWTGIAYADEKEYENAVHWYNRSLQINPNDSECLMRKGISLGLWGKYDEAITCFMASLELDPFNVGTLQCLGITYGLSKDYQAALEWYEKAHQLHPEDNSILYRKGELHYILGEYEKSLQCFDEALKIYPEDYEVLLFRVKTLDKLKQKNGEWRVPDQPKIAVSQW